MQDKYNAKVFAPFWFLWQNPGEGECPVINLRPQAQEDFSYTAHLWMAEIII